MIIGEAGIFLAMQAPLRFSIADLEGKVVMAEDGTGKIDAETLTISPKAGEPRSYSLRDIISIAESDYRIRVALAGGDELLLFNLGYKYEDFARNLVQTNNELSLHDLLMEERLRRPGVRTDFALLDPKGEEGSKGKCEVRLYETALVIMPERSDLIRIPYSELLTCAVDSYKVVALLESGGKVEFSRLGREADPLQREIAGSIAELSVRVQNLLKDVFPEADPNAILKASRFMKEGRAAKWSDLESACPGLWSKLERKIGGLGMAEEYASLSSRSKRERIRIGMKRTLAAGVEEDYVWFLAPIYSEDASKGGNAIAFEATSSEESGRATYFFRMMSRKDYSQTRDNPKLDDIADAASAETAKSLLAINFRREPIFLPSEKLYAPEYAHYRHSIARLPELRLLRDRFIGRVVHSSIEQWKLDVEDLLKFNVDQEGDAPVWKK